MMHRLLNGLCMLPILVLQSCSNLLSLDSAFGGMLAFCIIVGDTIPHVFAAAFPSLSSTPFLWILTNRQAIIILFILGISYPLALYRDIAKVSYPLYQAFIQVIRLIMIS